CVSHSRGTTSRCRPACSGTARTAISSSEYAASLLLLRSRRRLQSSGSSPCGRRPIVDVRRLDAKTCKFNEGVEFRIISPRFNVVASRDRCRVTAEQNDRQSVESKLVLLHPAVRLQSRGCGSRGLTQSRHTNKHAG